jgi:16S rRNA U516 pseudouridylate synthase RsuA-like enzyme
MFEAVGHPVRDLKRVMFAGLSLSHLPAGQWRTLTVPEILRLKKTVGMV